MTMHGSAWRFVVGLFCYLVGLGIEILPLNAQCLALVNKTVTYYQASTAVPVKDDVSFPRGGGPYVFFASVVKIDELPGTLLAATLVLPDNSTEEMDPGSVAFGAGVTTLQSNSFFYVTALNGNLDAIYPNGLYTNRMQFSFDQTAFGVEAVIPISGNLYQTNPPPTFINASNAAPYLGDAGTLPVLAGEDLVVAWRAVTNLVAGDLVVFKVVATNNGATVFTSEVALTNLAPRVVIPRQTLTNGTYEFLLMVDRESHSDIVVDSGVAIGIKSSYTTVTRLLLNVSSAVRLQKAARTGAGQFRFEFTTLSNRTYQVQSTTNTLPGTISWTTLLSTNAASTNVIIQRPLTHRAEFFRVISL